MMERGGFLGMCAAEWRKLRGRGLAWAVLLFGMLHGVASVVFLWLGSRAEASMAGEPVDSLTALVAGEMAVSLASLPVNGLALLLLFAVLWAEDFSLGTIAMIFVRPVARWRVFAAKCVVGAGVAMASVTVALGAGLVLGLPLFGLDGDLAGIGDGTPFIGWMGTTEGGLILPVLAGVGTGALVALPALALTALFAALTRSPVLTLFGSMMALLADAGFAGAMTIWQSFEKGSCSQAAMKAGAVSSREELDALPCPAAELPEQLHGLTIWAGREFLGLRGHPEFWSDAAQPILVTLGWSGLLLALALLLFTRRDIS